MSPVQIVQCGQYVMWWTGLVCSEYGNKVTVTDRAVSAVLLLSS